MTILELHTHGRTMRHDALLKAIQAAPDEDGPRLEYAQWLTERRDPLGEYIGLQVELAHLEPQSPKYKEIKRRALQLWVEHRDEWRRPFFELGVEAVEFHRGFPEGIRISAQEFLAHQHDLFGLAPIRHLTLTDASAQQLTEIADSRYLQFLTRLDVQRKNIGDGGAVALANSPHLTNLVSLNLGGNRISEKGARAIAESPHFHRLAYLDLSENPLSDGGAAAIACSPHLPNLAHLDLAQTDLGDVGTEAIAKSAALHRLTTLELGCNQISDVGALALAASSSLGNLRSLDLGDNQITDVGARALATSSNLARLDELDILMNRNVGDTVLREVRRMIDRRQQPEQPSL